MRLTEHYIETIKTNAKYYFGNAARVWLFGSRVDDSKKGGDIDLYIESDEVVGLEEKTRFIVKLQMILGDQKIDVILKGKNSPDKKKYQIAKKTGIEL